MNFFELLKSILNGSYKPSTSEIEYLTGYINIDFYSNLIETYFSQYLDVTNNYIFGGILMEITQIFVLLISWLSFLFVIFTDNEYKHLVNNFKSNFLGFSLLRKISFITFTLFTAIPIRVFINNKFHQGSLGINFILLFFAFFFVKSF